MRTSGVTYRFDGARSQLEELLHHPRRVAEADRCEGPAFLLFEQGGVFAGVARHVPDPEGVRRCAGEYRVAF